MLSQLSTRNWYWGQNVEQWGTILARLYSPKACYVLQFCQLISDFHTYTSGLTPLMGFGCIENKSQMHLYIKFLFDIEERHFHHSSLCCIAEESNSPFILHVNHSPYIAATLSPDSPTHLHTSGNLQCLLT